MPQEVHQLTCSQCATSMDVSGIAAFSQVQCPHCGHLNIVPRLVAHFQLMNLLGEGGMGSVYSGYDLSLQRVIAVKLLKKELSRNEEFITNFIREAQATALVVHPNVVQVYTFGEDDGQYYLVMELMDNGSLDDLIMRQGRITEVEGLLIGAQIAAGLGAAHHQGLIHRDLKPGNILFNTQGQAKLVDFGLAIFSSQESVPGEIWGTPYYIAPEKLSGGQEDFRSDIYSLGATIFHALAGRPPFEGANATEIVTKHMRSQAVSIQAFAPHVSGETAFVINKMLAKNPYDRYGSYDELVQHLQYAHNQVEQRLKQPLSPKASQHVVIPTEQSSAWMMWSGAVFGLGLLIVLSLVAFNYKKIFATGQDKVQQAQQQAQQQAAQLLSGIDPALLESWQKANDFFVTSQFPEAREEFKTLQAGLAGKDNIPFKPWVPLQALATVFVDREEAKTSAAFIELGISGQTPIPSKISPANLTRDMARILMIPDRKLQEEQSFWAAQPGDIRKMGFFYTALREIGRNDYERATGWFKLASSITASEAWMNRMDDLSNQYLRDMASYEKAMALIQGAGDATKAAEAMAFLQTALREIHDPYFKDVLKLREEELKSRLPK
ncbi:MAG: serine/threonine-protein kinase [Verrucomicrobiae bacterium]|nr:serine/threonine-protein kinase [Verrucomicrobiae bacterium]